MTSEAITFRLYIADFDATAAKELDTARRAVSAIEAKIIEDFKKSDRSKAISDLAGNYDSGSKRSVIPRLIGSQIECEVLVDIPAKAHAASPYFNITEKTANLLLSGKLLTDDQKKALIKRMGFDLDSLSAEV